MDKYRMTNIIAILIMVISIVGVLLTLIHPIFWVVWIFGFVCQSVWVAMIYNGVAYKFAQFILDRVKV